MPSIVPTLNAHIRRLARREVKSLLTDSRKRTAEHRRSIAALKREVRKLRLELATVKKAVPDVPKEVPQAVIQKSRLRIDGLKRHRQTLRLSAKDYGKLMGVSALTIYNWESGKTKPRRSQLGGIVAVRGIGKREALARLGGK